MHSNETDTFGDAIKRCNRLRAQPPALYNPARVNEQPIPPSEVVMPADIEPEIVIETNDSVIDPPEHNENDWDTSRASQQSILPTEFVDINQQIDQIANDSVAISTEHNQHSLDSTYFDSNAQNGSSVLDVKPIVQEDDEDHIAYAHLFDADMDANADPLFDGQQASLASNTSTDSEGLRESFVNAIQFESTRVSAVGSDVSLNQNAVFCHEQNENIDGTQSENGNVDGDQNELDHNDADKGQEKEDANKQQVAENLELVMLYGVKTVYDDDVEYIHIPDQLLQPIETTAEYVVKANDDLCGNIPFKEWVGDFALLILFYILILVHFNF